MLISLLILALIASGGFALTYLITDDESFLWRWSVGSIAGSALFGLVAFLAACLIAFSPVTLVGSLIITMLPLLLFRRPDIRNRFNRDRDRARDTLQGATTSKARRFAYYAFFLAIFWFFFDQSVYQIADGIYTGGSRNLGDLPFHLGAIFSFTEGNNFPPQNPSFAGAKFSYPFIADFLTACMMKLGAGFREAMVAQNVAWAFALLVILERFTVKLTRSKLAGRLAPALLFFSGGLGFVLFLQDASAVTTGFWDFLWKLPREYTVGGGNEVWSWGNSMEVLFITQRGILFGMPLTLMVLHKLWEIFSRPADEEDEGADKKRSRDWLIAAAVVGLLAGTLPLIHVHSLATLFLVTAFLFLIRPERWSEWLAFGVGVAVIAVPELAWTMAGSASDTSKFIGLHFGWDKRTHNFFWFWFANTGLFIPMLIGGTILLLVRLRRNATTEEAVPTTKPKKGKRAKAAAQSQPILSRRHIIAWLLFSIPFAALFVICNIFKFAPWEWDNIKILIYWFAGGIPLVAWLIAWAWEGNRIWKAAAVFCFIVLIFGGAIDVWRTMSGYVKSRVFDADAVAIAEQIKTRTPKDAVFLNAPTYNSAVVLAGRPSVMRYVGHLGSYGIDYGPREADLKRIYEGGGVAGINLEKLNVSYVLISPEEKDKLKANEEFFKKYPVIAESGAYRVYKIK